MVMTPHPHPHISPPYPTQPNACALVASAGAVAGVPISSRVDALEAALVANFPPVELFLVHRFTPGMYIRTLIMPAGSIVTSKIHLTEHPWVLTKGRLVIYNELDGTRTEIVAPAMGVTKAGTRRVAEIIEESHWTTFHATDETDPEVIEDQICLKHDAHLGGVKPVQRALEA